MNDKPGWGPEQQSPVPPQPAPPTAPVAPAAPTAPAYNAPAPGTAPYPTQPGAQVPGQGGYGQGGYGQGGYGQAGYGQGYPAAAAPYGAPPYGGMVSPTPPGKGLQVAALVLGILSLIVFLSWIALVCGILAIILGAVGRSKAKKAGAPTAMGTAGIVCGSIGVVVLVALIVLAFVYLANNPGYFMVG